MIAEKERSDEVPKMRPDERGYGDKVLLWSFLDQGR